MSVSGWGPALGGIVGKLFRNNFAAWTNKSVQIRLHETWQRVLSNSFRVSSSSLRSPGVAGIDSPKK